MFFSRKEKLRGTICFFLGIVLVFIRVRRPLCKPISLFDTTVIANLLRSVSISLSQWPFVGVCIEAFGFLNLFGFVHQPSVDYCSLVSRSLDPDHPLTLQSDPQRLLPRHPQLHAPTARHRLVPLTALHSRCASSPIPTWSQTAHPKLIAPTSSCRFPLSFHDDRLWTES